MTQPDITSAIAKLKALEEAATPGPWTYYQDTHRCYIQPEKYGQYGDVATTGAFRGLRPDNPAFIVAARNVFKALVECVQRSQNFLDIQGSCSSDVYQVGRDLEKALAAIARAVEGT